jgi:glycosyltransferase involved in cell wall biosynthesis
MPRVSIILPTYNWAKYIAHAIESVCKQTYTDYEFLIINDGSTDATEEIILSYSQKYPKIIYVKNEKNLHLVRTLNKWLHLAQGEYIARIDDDDERIDKRKLQKQIDFLDTHLEYGLVWTSTINVDENGKELGKFSFKETDQKIRKNMLIFNQFLHPSVLIRKSVIDAIGRYDEKAVYVEDYDLWLRMGQITKMYNLPDFATKYTIRSGSISWSKERNQKRNAIKTLIKYADYYPNVLYGVVFNVMSFAFPRDWIKHVLKASSFKDRVQKHIEKTMKETFNIDAIFWVKVKIKKHK